MLIYDTYRILCLRIMGKKVQPTKMKIKEQQKAKGRKRTRKETKGSKERTKRRNR